MQKVIVTGGAGFIGSYIVHALVERGYDVHIIDNLSASKKENAHPQATLHIVDIREIETLIPLFKDALCVFHEAAMPQVQYSIENPIETHNSNVNGTLNVLEACRTHGVKRVVFASSSAIYGNQEIMPVTEAMGNIAEPLSPYGAHKAIGEVYMKLYACLYGLETVCLRYFNVYGKGQSAVGSYASVIPRFVEFKKKGEPLPIVGDGTNRRDYVHVSDVVRANLQAMNSEKVGSGEVINIGTGKSFSVNYIAELVDGETVHIPPRIEPKESLADISQAKLLLDWEPEVVLPDAIQDIMSIV